MTLLALSINHRTAGLDLLARASMGREDAAELASALTSSQYVSESLVLSTCNRTEIYLDTSRFHAGLEAAVEPMARRMGVDRGDMSEYCAVYYDDSAIAHCFNLVAGLDSLVVGENQILGQVRDALGIAQRDHTSGPALNDLFQTALRVGKRVQSETSIGAAGRSVLSAALDQLEQRGMTPDRMTCLVVGAGAMAGLAARSLASRALRVDCANRTFAKAQLLADEIGGQAVDLGRLDELVGDYDIVVTCTGAAGRLISAESLEGGRAPRAILDLAMPPDVAEDVAKAGVLLVNLASLQAAGDDQVMDLALAQNLVDQEVQTFLGRRRAAAVTPTVVALRSMAQQVVEAELLRLRRRVPLLDDAALGEVGNSLNRVAEKLIHSPTVRVREFATQDEPVDYAAALRTLFSLEALEASERMSDGEGSSTTKETGR